MKVLRCVRIVIHVSTVLALLAGISLIAAGVMTTAWATFTKGKGVIYQHGLWMDYELTAQGYPQQEMVWVPIHKFGEKQQTSERDTGKIKPYELNTLLMLGVSEILGILAFLLSLCSGCYAFAAVGWPTSSILSAILATVALVHYYVSWLMEEHHNDSVPGHRAIGYSFNLAAIGTGCVCLATVLSIVCTVLYFVQAQKRRRSTKTFPKLNAHALVG